LSPSAAANRRFGFQFQAGDNATSDSHQSWDGTLAFSPSWRQRIREPLTYL
jgi:hypothetical protein